MKNKIFTAIIIFCIAAGVNAQENNDQKGKKDEIKTLLGKDISHGGYLGATFMYTSIDKQDAFNIGGRMGWIMNHSFAMGLAGYGFFNDIYSVDNNNPATMTNMAGGYGGFYIEPIIAPKFPVHVSLPVLFGIGGVAVNKRIYTNNYWEYYTVDDDVILVVEPGFEIEMNMMQNFRIALVATYRLTNDVQLQGKSKKVLDGLNTGITFKFGKF